MYTKGRSNIRLLHSSIGCVERPRMTCGAYSEASPLKVVDGFAVYNLLPHDSGIAFSELLENARGRFIAGPFAFFHENYWQSWASV